MLVFDIETEPQELADILKVAGEFNESTLPMPGPFREEDVKIGNLKDEAKIQAKIEEARKKWERDVATHGEQLEIARQEYERQLLEKAPLDAATGRVCAVGYKSDNGTEILDTRLDYDERQLIERCWQCFQNIRNAGRQIVGFNSANFDIPFLVRRSFIVGVTVPYWIFTPTRYLAPLFVDLMQIWQAGNRRDYISLDKVCKAMGVPGKPDDCTGAMFWRMLGSPNEAEREAAIGYLRNDLDMTLAVAQRMGISNK